MRINRKQLEAIRDGECLRVSEDGEDVVIISAEVYARMAESPSPQAHGTGTAAEASSSPRQTDIAYPLAGCAALFMLCFVCACIGAAVGHRDKSSAARERASTMARLPAPNTVEKPASPTTPLPTKEEKRQPETKPVKTQNDVDEFVESRQNVLPKSADGTDVNWLLWLVAILASLFIVGGLLVYWLFK